MKNILLVSLISLILVQACALAGTITPQAVQNTALPVESKAPATSLTSTPQPPTPTETSLPSQTPTSSLTPTITFTPTITETPFPSATPTFAFPVVTVNKQAHCRYGPNIAYLHAADLYAGDIGTVQGRFGLSKWLYIKFDKINYFCWVAPSVVDVTGDINTIRVMEFSDRFLPGPSVLYDPPQNVVTKRVGEKVNISWERVPMTDDDDRGYFIDMFVCQGGAYLWYPVALANRDKTSYTIQDESGCPEPSGGKLYAVEKHGYTRPVKLDWPTPEN